MLAGLIRTIGTVVLIWFVFRWLDRMARRWSNRQGPTPTPTGQSPRSTPKETPSPKDQKLGDYVDFEELKDKE